MAFAIDWNLAAVWSQAISSTVVLFMIYFQIRQVNTQIIQNDEQERFRRSWEFIKVYLDELRENSPILKACQCAKAVSAAEMDKETFETYQRYFYEPRLHLFVLLNKLVEHQEVDERLLFGYLDEDFNRFVELGVRLSGADEFKRESGSRIQILLNLWGTGIRAGKLLYSAGPAAGAASADAAGDADAAGGGV